MTDIILHHDDLSSFSEKIRLALGYKGLAWHSVVVDAVPPRPLLAALTGGYRRLPVLQMGADIYCDTEVIFRALERVNPPPNPVSDRRRLRQGAVALVGPGNLDGVDRCAGRAYR